MRILKLLLLSLVILSALGVTLLFVKFYVLSPSVRPPQVLPITSLRLRMTS